MDERQGELFLFWLVLQRLPGTAAATLQKLQGTFGGAAGIMNAPHNPLKEILGKDALAEFESYREKGMRSRAGQRALEDLEWLQAHRIHLLTIEDQHYPPQLKEVHSAPPLLMVDGDIRILKENQLAIVGSRKASPSGLDHAQSFAAELVECGYRITSGMALGIDSAAHRGALSVSADIVPKPTIAVIATGLDQCYPSRNETLVSEIRERGAIITEFPLGTAPQKENFPRRNRIISGLSCGVLVVEAEEKSGSLITARYALEQNREVFAIPGSIRNPGSRGCHQLIRQGARLVETVDDILSELQHPFGQIALFEKTGSASISKQTATPSIEQQMVREELNPAECHLLQFMDDCIITPDHLSRRASLPIDQILSLLLGLEIKGWVEVSAEGYRRQ